MMYIIKSMIILSVSLNVKACENIMLKGVVSLSEKYYIVIVYRKQLNATLHYSIKPLNKLISGVGES